MSSLFDPISIGKLKLDNRFVRSATMDSMADRGMVSDLEIDLYRELGKGDIGLIVSHGVYPTKEGQCSPRQLSAHERESVSSLSQIVEAVHEGGGKIAAQILHGGWMCSQEVTGLPPVGPSALIHPRSGARIHELSKMEILDLIDGYVNATERIIEAGFDAVQLHGAHSWLISAFLSPATNKRNDEWGGSFEGRSRFVQEIYHGMRRVAGPDYPILIKLGIKDYHPEGKSISEGIAVARLLQQDGFDGIEISEGLEEDFFHHIRRDATSPYYIEECAQAKRALSLPLILVGGMRTLKDMQKV